MPRRTGVAEARYREIGALESPCRNSRSEKPGEPNPHEAEFQKEKRKIEMTPVAEVQTNPNPASETRSVAVGTSAASASAISTTRAGTVFSATPGLPQLFQSNFDYQLARGMLAGAYGDGGAVGESFTTARRIKDKDIDSWTVEWAATASRIEGIATKCLG